MDKELLELSLKLKNAISNDSDVLELNKIEEEMNNSLEVISLSKIKEEKLDAYNFALSHFAEDSSEVEKARKELYEAKKELEMHPIVRKYLSLFKKVREMNEEINNSLFNFINEDLCHGASKK